MQAFAYTHYVPSRQLIFQTGWFRGNGDRLFLDPKFNCRVTLTPGKSRSVNVFYRINKMHSSPQAEFSLDDAPKGVVLTSKKIKQDLYRITFTADKKAPRCDVNIPVKVKYSYKYFEKRRKEWRTSNSTFHLPMFRLTVR